MGESSSINSSDDYVGLFRRLEGARIEDVVLENVNVIGGNKVGGLAGETYDSYVRSSVSGNVIGNKNIGALIGESNFSTIENSFSKENVISGGDIAGGLVGLSNRSNIENSYAVADVVGGGNFAGGLVGRSTHSTITNTFSVGRIVGRVHTGGLVGQSIGTDIINSYYNKNSSGQSDSNKGEPKTTEELKEKSTYQDWDFQNTWNINEGDYPFLR